MHRDVLDANAGSTACADHRNGNEIEMYPRAQFLRPTSMSTRIPGPRERDGNRYLQKNPALRTWINQPPVVAEGC